MPTLILLALLLFAQQAPQRRPPQRQQPQTAAAPELKPEDYGRVEGTVINSMTGEPIRRAEVRLLAAERRQTDDPASVVTDASGRFVFSKVAPGRFALRSSRNGFVAKSLATPVQVSTGQTLSNVTITMLPQAVVTGRVTDEEGEPLARVSVTAYRYAYPQGRKTLVPAESSTTNDLGEYRLWGLSRGAYYLAAVSYANWGGGGGRPRPASAEDPLAPTFHPSAASIENATQIRLNPGMQLPNLDIQMRRSKTYKVTGTVTDAATGQPASRASISVSGEAVGLQPGGARTMSREGQFTLSGIAPGSYTITARSFSEGRGDGNTPSLTGQLRVEVSNGDVNGVRIAMRKPEPLSGVVKLDGGEATLSSMRVQLESLESSQGMGGNTMGSGVAEDGKFTIANLAASRYRLRLNNVPAGYYLKSIVQGNQEVQHSGIEVALGGELTVTLAQGAGSVEGAVRDEKDQPRAQVTLVLIPKDAWTGYADAIRTVTSGADGSYQIPQLAPGEYELFAFEDAESGSWYDPGFRALYRDQAKTVRVEKGTAAKADLRPITVQ